MSKFSVIHAPIVKYNVYIVEHEENENPLEIWHNWNGGDGGPVEDLGDFLDEGDGGLPTTLEATYDTYNEAEASEEAQID